MRRDDGVGEGVACRLGSALGHEAEHVDVGELSSELDTISGSGAVPAELAALCALLPVVRVKDEGAIHVGARERFAAGRRADDDQRLDANVVGALAPEPFDRRALRLTDVFGKLDHRLHRTDPFAKDRRQDDPRR